MDLPQESLVRWDAAESYARFTDGLRQHRPAPALTLHSRDADLALDLQIDTALRQVELPAGFIEGVRKSVGSLE